MSAFYSIVQYVPDLVRDERVNIGVVAFTDDDAKCHFIENWERVRQFGGKVAALQDVVRCIDGLSREALGQTIASWQQSIQFTTPRASLLDIDPLLIDIAKRCLIDPEKHTKAYRDRQQAVSITKKHLSSALQDEIGKAATKLVRLHYSLPGRLDKHECDLAVVNGKPLVAVNSLSYEVPQSTDFIKAVHATT